jgi:hypothetical protein
MGLETAFNQGEAFFERNVTVNQAPFKGRGPAAVRKSCLDCHPGYGHGQWKNSYKANGSEAFGNGYLLVIYHQNADNPNDGPYVAEVTGMPQTMAEAPFLPPIDEDQITISWIPVGAMESGLPMTFPDGEKYELIYPELMIPESAFNTVPTPYRDGPGGRATSWDSAWKAPSASPERDLSTPSLRRPSRSSMRRRPGLRSSIRPSGTRRPAILRPVLTTTTGSPENSEPAMTLTEIIMSGMLTWAVNS